MYGIVRVLNEIVDRCISVESFFMQGKVVLMVAQLRKLITIVFNFHHDLYEIQGFQ